MNRLKNLTIVVNASFNTPKNAEIFITGNLPNCEWQAKCLSLKASGHGSYSRTIQVPAGNYQLKATRGSWNSEASDARGRAYWNHNVDVSNDQDQSTVIDVINWLDLGPLKKTGQYQHVERFYSPELGNERALDIWLPPNYFDDSNKRYPVIYAHDGQNLFDPQESSFGVDWSLDEVMTRLIKERAISPAIIVGIHHLDREKEFNDADKGSLYSRFLVDTLKPFIDANFQTLPDKDHSYLLGSSFGGVISTTTLIKNSHVFSRAAALSIKSHGFEEMLFSFIEDHHIPKNVSLYMDNGNWGVDAEYVAPNRRFFQKLLSVGFPREKLIHREFQWADHNETAWARRADIALKFLLDDSMRHTNSETDNSTLEVNQQQD